IGRGPRDTADARSPVLAVAGDVVGESAGGSPDQYAVRGGFRGPVSRSVMETPGAVAGSDRAWRLASNAARGPARPVPAPGGSAATGPAALPAPEERAGPVAGRPGTSVPGGAARRPV